MKFDKKVDGVIKKCIKNIKTGKINCYKDIEKRKTGIYMKHAFAHGWKPANKR